MIGYYGYGDGMLFAQARPRTSALLSCHYWLPWLPRCYQQPVFPVASWEGGRHREAVAHPLPADPVYLTSDVQHRDNQCRLGTSAQHTTGHEGPNVTDTSL